jgi:hypothetical protein
MELRAGQRLGPYVLIEPSGSGGMGEVYKARDTRLNRLVAIKVIASSVSDRSDFRQRFAAEARAIAALNHPHICALYDAGHDAGRDYLVLEYLEGEPLSDRLSRGALPMRELLVHAIAIADALDYAHRAGVIHRDLKPSNVFLTRKSGAKLLDFGLSTLRLAAADSGDLSDLATQPAPVTIGGALVGTLHYLAPERLDGQEADARSDIFAFGAILYEMATGKKAFDERSKARLIAAILSQEPVRLDAAASVPGELLWILQNCLAKNPDERWQSIGDVGRMLRAVAGRGETRPDSTVERGRPKTWIAATALLTLVVVVLGMALLMSRREAPAPQAARVSFPVLAPAGGFGLTESSVRTAQFAIAPDGHALVFVVGGSVKQLWIRTLDATESRPVTGTHGAAYPFWSADSRFVGFFADGRLKKVRLPDGPAEIICDARDGRGGAWNAAGDIVFVPNNAAPLHRVSASPGAASSPLTTLPAAHMGHRWPQFLPDGKRVLFFVRSSDPQVRGIYAVRLDRPAELRRLRGSETNGMYAHGRLLFVLDGVLVAQPIDPETLALSGEGIPLGFPTGTSSNFYSAFSVSDNAVLATWSPGAATNELVWYDANGSRIRALGPPGRHVDFRLSPDDRQLAVARVADSQGSPDLWILDLVRNTWNRIPATADTDATPIWSPDGQRLVFRSNRRSLHDLYERPANTTGQDRLVHHSSSGLYPTDWAQDGRTILYHSRQLSHYDIYKVGIEKPVETAVVASPHNEAQAQVSVHGQMAYMSDETGEPNIFVAGLDPPEAPQRVSVEGGITPRWRADGRLLFYLTLKGDLVAAEIGRSPSRVIRTERLFATGLEAPDSPYLSNYVVQRDGQRFLFKVPIDRTESQPIVVTMNWTSLR